MLHQTSQTVTYAAEHEAQSAVACRKSQTWRCIILLTTLETLGLNTDRTTSPSASTSFPLSGNTLHARPYSARPVTESLMQQGMKQIMVQREPNLD